MLYYYVCKCVGVSVCVCVYVCVYVCMCICMNVYVCTSEGGGEDGR